MKKGGELSIKKYKKGDVVNIPVHGTYFINGLSEELQKIWERAKSGGVGRQEYEMAKRKINIVNSKYFTEDNDVAATMRSWFNDKDQPSEAQVRRAMIWAYDQYGDYKIKSGGESSSDHVYISSLTATIADPVTGNDRDVIIIKKYSTDFKDVLITIDEVQKLQDATEVEEVRKVRRIDEMNSIISLILRHQRGFSTVSGGKMAPEEWIDKAIKQLADDYSQKEIDVDIDRRIVNVIKDSEESYIGDTEEKVKKRKEDAFKRTEEINGLRNKINSLRKGSGKLDWYQIRNFDVSEFGMDGAEAKADKYIIEHIAYHKGAVTKGELRKRFVPNAGPDWKGEWIIEKLLPIYAKGGIIKTIWDFLNEKVSFF